MKNIKVEIEREIFENNDEIKLVVTKSGEVMILTDDKAEEMVASGEVSYASKEITKEYMSTLYNQTGINKTTITTYNVRRWIVAQMHGFIKDVIAQNETARNDSKKISLSHAMFSRRYDSYNHHYCSTQKQLNFLIDEIRTLMKMEENPLCKEDFEVRKQFFNLVRCQMILHYMLNMECKKAEKDEKKNKERKHPHQKLLVFGKWIPVQNIRPAVYHMRNASKSLMSDEITTYKELFKQLQTIAREGNFPRGFHNKTTGKRNLLFKEAFVMSGMYYSIANIVITRDLLREEESKGNVFSLYFNSESFKDITDIKDIPMDNYSLKDIFSREFNITI